MAIKFNKGDKFNRLTILDDKYAYSKSDSKGGNVRRYWRCLCDCGNETFVSASSIKNGSIKSCGCYLKERIIETSRIDETGNRYGKLLVLEYDHTENNRAYWKCQCDCGNIIVVQAPHLRTGNTTSCGECNHKSLGELAIANILNKNNIEYSREKRFSSCKDKNLLPFDFALYNNDKLLCLIEFQGIQHYKASGGWSTNEALAYTQRHDRIKAQWCLDNNIPLEVISYNEDINERILYLLHKYNLL